LTKKSLTATRPTSHNKTAKISKLPLHRSVYHLRRLRSVRHQLGRDVTARLVSALVLSRLDYCKLSLSGFQPRHWHRRRVINAAARLVAGLGPRDHVSHALYQLHWLPIAQRIEYKICLLVHKSFVGHVPDYIIDLRTPDAASDPSRTSLRSSSSSNLIVRWARRKIGDRAFSVAAPHIWNRIPTELKIMRSTTAFKRHLKTFFIFFRLWSVLS